MTTRIPPNFQRRSSPDLPAPIVQAIKGINEFAFRLLSHLATSSPDKNIFCSPLSIATAFTMVGHGAIGDTREEILKCFGLAKLSREEIGAAFKFFASQSAANADDEVTLALANSLWQDETDQVNPDYVAAVKRIYGADSVNINFSQSDAAEIINHWVAEQTNHRINQLVTPSDLAGVVLVLLNAVYFKANWQKRFDPSRTAEQPFAFLDSRIEMRLQMQQLAKFDYVEHEFFQAVDLPYGTGNYRMAVILPKPTIAFAEFQQRFDNSAWQEIQSHFRQVQLYLSLPRFSISQQQQLNAPMMKLSVTKAFDRNAEFPLIGNGLFISKVIHQATLIVNEEGSEASAATAVMMTRGGPSRPIEMRVDHPFLCIIYHADSGMLLFAGYILDPK